MDHIRTNYKGKTDLDKLLAYSKDKKTSGLYHRCFTIIEVWETLPIRKYENPATSD